MITSDYTARFLTQYHYLERKKMSEMYRMNASAVVDALIREIETKGGGATFMGNADSEEFAKVLIQIINNPPSPYDALNMIQSPQQVWQRMDYVASNLIGSIFYFVCSACENRAKYLYSPRAGMKAQYQCRKCWRLRYPKKKKVRSRASTLLPTYR